MSLRPHPFPLPDVAGDTAASARALDWVGMRGIALPLRVAGEDGAVMQVPASVDVLVDLRDPDARGIHMSRLYLQLQDALVDQALTPARVRQVLRDCVRSQGALSSSARLVLRFDLLLRRRALASDNSGWKRYPLEIDAVLSDVPPADDALSLSLGFSVEYSSTCPASAALSRQLNAARFVEDFAQEAGAGPDAGGAPAIAAVRDWLASERGLAATPHAQRSRAEIRVDLGAHADVFPAADLIDRVEAALATPVQTAVKREDEQAFARLNAENLMFCEDAARRVAAALAGDARIRRYDARVSHFESLHPHDAVAQVSGAGNAAG